MYTAEFKCLFEKSFIQIKNQKVMDTSLTRSFYPYSSPTLKTGDFSIQIEQTVGEELYTNTNTYQVVGSGIDLERNIFKLFPTETIRENNVLPYVCFDNKSIPWERQVVFQDEPHIVPWLALLTFREDEFVAEIRGKKFTDFILKEKGVKNLSLKNVDDFKEYETTECFYIEISQALFNKIAPAPKDLKWLAHVREEMPFTTHSEQYLQQLKANSNEQESPKFSYLSGNRLPAEGTNVVYLVSFQNYDDKEFSDSEKIRLLVFKKWSFTLQNKNTEDENFKAYLERMAKDKNNLFKLEYKDDNETITQAINEGFVPIRHRLRNGNETVSFYRSPLLPFDSDMNSQETISSDNSIRYNKKLAMLDETYASAFQLGRLMAMQNENIAKKIYYNREEILQSFFLEDHLSKQVNSLKLGIDNEKLSFQESSLIALCELFANSILK